MSVYLCWVTRTVAIQRGPPQRHPLTVCSQQWGIDEPWHCRTFRRRYCSPPQVCIVHLHWTDCALSPVFVRLSRGRALQPAASRNPAPVKNNTLISVPPGASHKIFVWGGAFRSLLAPSAVKVGKWTERRSSRWSFWSEIGTMIRKGFSGPMLGPVSDFPNGFLVKADPSSKTHNNVNVLVYIYVCWSVGFNGELQFCRKVCW